MKEHIEHALRELPLAESEIPALATKLATFNVVLKQNRALKPGSAMLDFRAKLAAVADYYAGNGLTLAGYLAAAVSQPTLFFMSPATVIGHIDAVVSHFAEEGLSLSGYLSAAVARPSLFYQSPATIIANIESVTRHFFSHGLTLKDYLSAAVQSPSLFYQSPATIIANIEGVARHFRKEGLTLEDYVFAALRKPSLFTRTPATIIRHIERIIDMHRQGLLTFPQQDAPTQQPLDRPTRAVFLVGYEGQRLEQALEQTAIQPSKTSIVFGVPAYQAGWEMDAFANNLGVIQERRLDRGGALFAGAQNPVAAYRALDKVYRSCHSGERLLVGPIGTKPHGIGAALFACDHPDVGVVYDHPKRSKGRSAKIGSWHLFQAQQGEKL